MGNRFPVWRRRADPADDNVFELLRQQQETRNETVINYLQMTVFAIVLVANVATHFSNLAPYRASAALIGFVAGALLIRVWIFAYLRRTPRYQPWRKYIFSSLDLVINTAASLILAAQAAYSWLFLNLFTICIFAMLVTLSGLRYSTQVVVFTGVVAILMHALFFTHRVESELRLPTLLVSFLTLGCVTFCTAYSVRSLVRIHRDATLKEQLARFLSPELVEQMMRSPDLLTRRTERRNATVIFTDIRGFTRFSEQLSPEQVVEFLNEFLEEMTAAIMQHQGMLDKYIGDAVMGVFGVPFYAEDHALRALRAAMEMRDRLVLLNQKLVAKGLPELSIGVGLHTGDLLIGAIGSNRRLDYTVIGDTVNVAARIEGLTRSYPVEILVSDATRMAVGQAVSLYEIATVQVKNRQQPLTLWSPDPPRETL